MLSTTLYMLSMGAFSYRGPVHSQGPSHFSGYGAYSDDKEAHDSRSVTKPSPASHDSRGPMLASKGLLARTDRGPNTGVHNTVNSTSILGNFDTTIQRSSYERVSPPPLDLLVLTVRRKKTFS